MWMKHKFGVGEVLYLYTQLLFWLHDFVFRSMKDMPQIVNYGYFLTLWKDFFLCVSVLNKLLT